MNYDKNRKILADVDGVLLDWESGFDSWMLEKHGLKVKNPGVYGQNVRYDLEKSVTDSFVKVFNESAWIGFLKPLRDSVSVLDELASLHWHIECITSLSTDHWAGELRRLNLQRFFGRGVIRRCQCIETGGDKDEPLSQYSPTWWIEDKPQNCLTGLKFGHKPILIDHPYNKDFEHPDIIRVRNWAEIQEIINS